MRFNQKVLARISLALGLSLTSLQAATNFGNVRFVMQTDATHTVSEKGLLILDEKAGQLSFSGTDHKIVSIPYSGIQIIRFDNSVERLRRPFTNRVGRNRFLTVEYKADENTPKYAIFKLNAKSYREVLAALESETTKRIQYREN